MRDQLSTLDNKHTLAEIAERWPHLRPYLRVTAVGEVDYDYFHWGRAQDTLGPAERTAPYEEWADFFEWRLGQRAAELAADRIKRHMVAKWTDSMAYCCRRSAVLARGEDPGEAVPQWVRRPDLDAEGRAIVDEIVTLLDTPRERAVLCKAG